MARAKRIPLSPPSTHLRDSHFSSGLLPGLPFPSLRSHAPWPKERLVIDRSLVRPNYSAEASAEASAEPNLKIPGRTEPNRPQKIRILKPGANHFLSQ